MAIRKYPSDQNNEADDTTKSKRVPTEQELLRKLKTYLSMKVIMTRGLFAKYASTSQDRDYTVERNYVREIIMEDSMVPEACLLGIVIATSSFVLLSRLPRLGMALGQRSTQPQGGSWYTLDIPPGEEKGFTLFSRITNLMLFLPFSALMGGLAARDVIHNYANHKLIAEKLSKLPLVPGRSVVSDEICPTLIEATLKIQDCQLKPFKSQELRHYMTFAHNCQARKYYEQIMREERDSSASSLPVVVSPTGVPSVEERDYGVWTERAVLDQEEEARRSAPPR
jgi:hypothetical protein